MASFLEFCDVAFFVLGLWCLRAYRTLGFIGFQASGLTRLGLWAL